MISRTAPDFALPSLSGEIQTLRASLSQTPVLLAFFKVACPTCQLAFPFLERLHRAGVKIFAISQDNAAATSDFNRRYGITIPTLLDTASSGYAAGAAYRITNVPSLFVVEPDGRISGSVTGFHKAELERVGQLFGINLFTGADRVPVFRPG